MKLPFELLLDGEFARPNLLTTWRDEGMAKTPETQRLIEETWAAAECKRRQSGGLLFPGKLCRLSAWSSRQGRAELEFGPTDYRELVGTNLTRPGLAAELGPNYLSNGSGICSVVVTSDGKLLLQQRNRRVHEFPGAYHVCGGNMEPRLENGAPHADPFWSILSELYEELAIQETDIVSISCIGAARDTHTLKPEILFKTAVSLPSTAFQREGEEHQQLVFLENAAPVLLDFLIASAGNFVPVGLACVTQYGKLQFGDAWYDELTRRAIDGSIR